MSMTTFLYYEYLFQKHFSGVIAIWKRRVHKTIGLRRFYRFLILYLTFSFIIVGSEFFIIMDIYTVADPGFDLRGGVDFVNEGGG